MKKLTERGYDPHFQITSTTYFHDFILQLVYNYGWNKEDKINQIWNDVNHMYQKIQDTQKHSVTQLKTLFIEKNIHIDEKNTDVFLEKILQKMNKASFEEMKKNIIELVQDLSEYVNMDLSSMVELEQNEKHLTSEDIQRKVIFSLVISQEYDFQLKKDMTKEIGQTLKKLPLKNLFKK